MTLTVILALPLATFLIGGFIGACMTLAVGPRIDAGVALDGDDDKPFIDEWTDDLRTRPIFSSEPRQLYNVDEDPGALALVRPKPYPPPRLVR